MSQDEQNRWKTGRSNATTERKSQQLYDLQGQSFGEWLTDKDIFFLIFFLEIAMQQRVGEGLRKPEKRDTREGHALVEDVLHDSLHDSRQDGWHDGWHVWSGWLPARWQARMVWMVACIVIVDLESSGLHPRRHLRV